MDKRGVFIIILFLFSACSSSSGVKHAPAKIENPITMQIYTEKPLPSWYSEPDFVVKNEDGCEMLYLKASGEHWKIHAAEHEANMKANEILADSIICFVFLDRSKATELGWNGNNSQEFYSETIASKVFNIDTKGLLPAGEVVEYVIKKRPGYADDFYYRVTIRKKINYQLYQSHVRNAKLRDRE